MARGLSTHPLMRRRAPAAVAAALVVAIGVLTASSASPASSSQADHLRAIETARLQALVEADTATARKLTAPDFQLINPAGAALSRDEFLGGVDAGVIDFLALDPASPIAVRLSGDSATLRYQVTVNDPGAYTRPWTGGWTLGWVPNVDIEEYFCDDNNKETEHLSGKHNKP